MGQILSRKKWGALVAVLCAAVLALSLVSAKAFAAEVSRTAINLGTTNVTLTAEKSEANYKFTAPDEGWYSFASTVKTTDSYVRTSLYAEENLGGTFGETRYDDVNGTTYCYIKLAKGQVANYDVEDHYAEGAQITVVVAKATVSTDINSVFYEGSMSPVYLNNGALVASPDVTITDANGDYLVEGRDFMVSTDFYVDATNGNGYSIAPALKLPETKTDEDGDTYQTGGWYYVKVTGIGAYKGDRYIEFRTENYRNIDDLERNYNPFGIISGGKIQNTVPYAYANLGGKYQLVRGALSVVKYTESDYYWDDEDYVAGKDVVNGSFKIGERYNVRYKPGSGFVGTEHNASFLAVDANGSAGTAYGKPMELVPQVNKDVMVQPEKPVYVKFTAPVAGHYFIGNLRDGSESRLYADAALNTPVFDDNLAKGQTVYALFNNSYGEKYDDPMLMTLSVLPNTELIVAEKVKATGKAVTPAVTVKYLGKTLVANKDYKVTYANNVKPGTATVTVEGIGKYKNDLKMAKNFLVVAAKGKTYKVGALKYKVTNANTEGKGTVTVKGAVKGKKKTKSVKIPNTVKIGKVKYKVTAIDKNAFKGYTKLTKVTIGKNVKSIGKNAFYKDKKLKKIVVKAKKLKVGKNAIKGINAKAVIDVPNKNVKAYKKVFKASTGYKYTMKVK